ncbi:pentatricopeptide repeat-containing protein chloroplastic [Dorcoceras hygrometricum]|uniref:Pentatricopeptide repeat-containing protein chloroplastic n=1 Tax=Dorcoceras hygrometricum TaxID=472368 RepID=A0A2Z7CF27_9LAMI|nr:pentatricopeptide repeat-containing protein chloroplastic [Dorcoceras hygrometricum]
MLAGNTTREVESDTVVEQELKTVKRDFEGLNEGIWPKSSLGHQTRFDELCSLDRSGGSSTGLMRKYANGGQIRPADVIYAKGAAGPAGTLKDQAGPADEERPAGARRRQYAVEKMNQPLRRQISWNVRRIVASADEQLDEEH